MYRRLIISAVMANALLTGGALAQGNAPAGYNETMINAGGGADAVGVICEKSTLAQAKAHRASLRKYMAGQGVPGAVFDTNYDRGFNEAMTRAKANPAQARAACAQLARGARP